MNKKLYLSTDDKKISGVCGGIAEYFSIDPTVVRLAWVLFSMFTVIFGGVLAYILAVLIIPERP